MDTTNPFGPAGVLPLPSGFASTTAYNQSRAHGARLVKAYNTLTAGFQADSAHRTGERVAMPYATLHPEAGQVVAALIRDSGFDALDVSAAPQLIDAPRRAGALYGEEWTLTTGRAFLSSHA